MCLFYDKSWLLGISISWQRLNSRVARAWSAKEQPKMPIYVAVRCFSCEMFQVIQKPKSNKFNCRVCNEKQSVRKLYCKSDKAKDCRLVVQQYNKKHGEMIREARTGMFQENLEEQEFDRSEEVNSSYHHTGASGNWNILYQKKSNQWEEYLSDSDDHGNSFYGTADEDDKEAQKYVFEVPKPKRKKKRQKRQRPPSDSFVASSKKRKGPNKPNSRDNYGIDSGISTLKDKSNITHRVEFVKDELPKNMRIHEQSTISSNETKSYMKCKSNVSKHTTETFQNSGERKKTQWDEFLSEEESSCDDTW